MRVRFSYNILLGMDVQFWKKGEASSENSQQQKGLDLSSAKR